MTWRVLISAPYFLPVVEDYRPQLEAAGLELVIADVREHLSEEELLPDKYVAWSCYQRGGTHRRATQRQNRRSSTRRF